MSDPHADPPTLAAVRLLLRELPSWAESAESLPGRFRSVQRDLGNAALAANNLGEPWADELARLHPRDQTRKAAEALLRDGQEHLARKQELTTAARAAGVVARRAGLDPAPLLALLEEGRTDLLADALRVLQRADDELAYEAGGGEAADRVASIRRRGAVAAAVGRLRIEGEQVLLDGRQVPLEMTPEARNKALVYLGYLVKAAGDWVSGGDIDRAEQERPGGLHGTRWDRVRRQLPEPIRALIHTNRRKGSRLGGLA
jgi:hypothetical protein